MATFPFSVTVESTPPIEVFGVNISYNEILNSLGSYYYLIEQVFTQSLSSDMAQIAEPFSFNKFDSNGLKKLDISVPSPDPYQKQPAYLTDIKQLNIIADGRLIIATVVLSFGSVRYTFTTERGSLPSGLDKYSISNQKKVQRLV